MSSKEDLKLIAKIKKGDKQALSHLIDKYLPQLFAFYKYMRVPESSIDDFIQDTFIKVMEKLDLYDENRKFSTWILTVAKNTFIDQCRKETRRAEIRKEILIEKEPVGSIEDKVIVKQSTEELLRGLSEEERLLVELRIFQGVPFSEISEMTGEFEATLRSRFFRTLAKLRKRQTG
jgi:RNA polymerase sigma-70 factor (ECF subfamily)